MNAVFLGTDHDTGEKVFVPPSVWSTHWHGVGATGTGKTTALLTMIFQLLADPSSPACHFIFDRLGGLSYDLLLWIASPYCPQFVRDRFLYINPANEERVLTFHPITHTSEAHLFYRVGRTIDCILRGFENQNVADQPRTFTWLFNLFFSEGLMNMAVADSYHLLYPGSDYHEPFLNAIPPRLKAEWSEVLNSRGGEAVRILEAARNRMKPYVEAPVTRRFFGSTTNRFDVERFQRGKMIVLINLAPQERLEPRVSDAIGGMMLNEILCTARSSSKRYRTFIWLDEFQRYVGPDMQEAIPEVRQLLGGGGLCMFHQSLSQLERGDVDLKPLMWQPRNRLMFALQGEDADIMAHEVATMKFDPNQIKEEMYSRRQLLKGHHIELLCTWSEAEAQARSWSDTVGTNWSAAQGESKSSTYQDSQNTHRSVSRPEGEFNDGNVNYGKSQSHSRSGGNTSNESNSQGGNNAHSAGGSKTSTLTRGKHETLVPEYEEFLELTKREYVKFDELRTTWARTIRLQKTGQALVKLANESQIRLVDLQRYSRGYMAWDRERVERFCPQALEAVEMLLEKNFANRDFFVSPQEIDRETHERLQRVLNPAIEVRTDEPLMIEGKLSCETVAHETELAGSPLL